MSKKYTEKDYIKAVDVAWYFEDKWKKDQSKWKRKAGIKYILCQHLKEKTQDQEAGNMWIGETTRLIQCPICLNVNLGSFAKLFKIDLDRDADPQPTEAEKQPVKENWKEWLINKLTSR